MYSDDYHCIEGAREVQRVHNVRGRQPNPWKVQHRSCLESHHLGLYHTCPGGSSSCITPVLQLCVDHVTHHFCSVQETRVRGSSGQRVHLSQNPPQVQTLKFLEFFNLHSIQVRQSRPTGPPRGLWQVLRVLWERNLQQGVLRQAHGLWRVYRVVQTCGGGVKIFLIMIMHLCNRCRDARTSTRKKNNCTFGRLDSSATPWIIYNTIKYIFWNLLSHVFFCVKGFDTRPP